MDWLSKIQGNMQALINSGRIKPETASKLEQFAAEQKQRASAQSGIEPIQLKSNQDKKEQQEQGAGLSENIMSKFKGLFSSGTAAPKDLGGVGSSSMMNMPMAGTVSDEKV